VGAAAKQGCCVAGGVSCSPGDATGAFGGALYDDATCQVLPEAALNASLGCGVPTALADLHEGETVLDLGSGAGADVLISARRVGPSGKAIGIDMTDEMLELARATRPRPASRTSSSSRGISRSFRLTMVQST
jgi:SAM-dependent methyltransferase